MASLAVFFQQKIAAIAAGSTSLAHLLNRVVVNRLMGVTRTRPHPWSTKTDYVSWSALSDRTYAARHLPAAIIPDLPPQNEVAALFSRASSGQYLCPKSTTLFPAFAQYLTDGFLRTAVFNDSTQVDRKRTTSTHEIDLCQLYGRTEAQTNILRVQSNVNGERGRLKSQLIKGEEFPPFMYDKDGVVLKEFDELDPPLGLDDLSNEVRATLFAVGGDRTNANLQVSMINTLLLREHNRLAGVIEASNPSFEDRRVFETVRNILIVMFIKVVVEEYINHITPSPIRFLAEPSAAWRAKWNRPNWMAIEFGLLYRWHSLVPETTDWLGQKLPVGSFRFANTLLYQTGLAKAFVEVSKQKASRLGIGNTSDFLIPVEKAGIDQSRLNHVDTYNAYRKTMGKKVARRWQDISSNQELCQRLAAVYGPTPEKLEFYTGLFAEDRMANSPLPELILTMVSVDAFSQAFTNPLLSEPIWGDPKVQQETFTREGLNVILETACLRDILARNADIVPGSFIGMTRQDWSFGNEKDEKAEPLVAC